MRRILALSVLTLLAGCGVIDKVTGPDGLSIDTFLATPAAVSPGETVTLSWNVSGAETVQIDGSTVQEKGSKEIQATQTRSYTLTAKAGTSQATSTVQVTVAGSPAPTPTPSPTPSPTPTPEPSPSPSPSPTPEPTPTPESTPTPTPSSASCGEPVTSANSCDVTVEYPEPLGGGECVEVNLLTVDQPCPVSMIHPRLVRFDLKANTTKSLQWRRQDTSSDVLEPNSGAVGSSGVTSVTLSDIVLQSSVAFEVVDDQGKVRLRVRLKHF